MTIVAEIKNPVELHIAGMKALDDALGHNNAQTFLKQCRGTPGRDYTKWRKEQPEPSTEEVETGIANAAATARTDGWLSDKNVINR
ncbi:hypothetical protein R80B4_00871 [Fibrobacteres bacterium R8-0-B4]